MITDGINEQFLWRSSWSFFCYCKKLFRRIVYDEYVIINNPNKNHPDNGKIFRRGYDYNSDRTLSAITLLVDGDGNYYQNVTEEKYKDLLDTDSFVTVETYQENH